MADATDESVFFQDPNQGFQSMYGGMNPYASAPSPGEFTASPSNYFPGNPTAGYNPAPGNYNYGGMGGNGAMSMGGPSNSALSPYISSVTRSPQNQAMLNNLIQSMQMSQQNQQNAANQQYASLMKTVKNTNNQVQGQFNQLGQAGLQQIQQQKQLGMGAATQSAYGRGLGNTTILNSLQSGVNRNAQNETTNLNSQIAGQKAGYDLQLGQMNGDAILSKQNQPIDTGMYLNLIQSLAGGR